MDLKSSSSEEPIIVAITHPARDDWKRLHQPLPAPSGPLPDGNDFGDGTNSAARNEEPPVSSSKPTEEESQRSEKR
ncbi:MAG: hypothetical protein M1840_006959 [Geoglossum simile]|nr:MAG: hypothetical protein M1840_006959 [Geoglossum simile]